MSISDSTALNKMAEDDKEVYCFPLSDNFKYARTGKNGWGEITIAVPNNLIANIDKYIGGLYMANLEQFKDIKGNK